MLQSADTIYAAMLDTFEALVKEELKLKIAKTNKVRVSFMPHYTAKARFDGRCSQYLYILEFPEELPAPKPGLEWRPDKFYNRSYYAERDGSRFEVYRDNLLGMWTLYAKDAEGNIVSGTEYYPTMALAKAAAENLEPIHA